MKLRRYGIYEAIEATIPWWGRFYCVGPLLADKPLVLLPTPVYWMARLGRDVKIGYLWLRLRLRRRKA